MSDWLGWHTLIAFLLGVLLSAMVKSAVARVRSKVA
jgi:hypothetical protein